MFCRLDVTMGDASPWGCINKRVGNLDRQ